MNYKCTNAGCGWEGDLKDMIHNAYVVDFVCPKCHEICKQLNYTRVPPTEPGYYWYRVDKDSEAEPVEIIKDKKSPYSKFMVLFCSFIEHITEYWYYHEGICNMRLLADVDGEWSERIEPPE